MKFLGDAVGRNCSQVQASRPQSTEDYGLLAAANGQIAPSENSFRLSTTATRSKSSRTTTSHRHPGPVADGVQRNHQQPRRHRLLQVHGARRARSTRSNATRRGFAPPLDSVMYVLQRQGSRPWSATTTPTTRTATSASRSRTTANTYVQVIDHLGRRRARLRLPRRIHAGEARRSPCGFRAWSVTRSIGRQIYVPRGNRFRHADHVVSRGNFGGPMCSNRRIFPQGIKMVAEEMPANLGHHARGLRSGCRRAASRANWSISARGTPIRKQKISGGFYNRADFVIAEPGQSLYRWRDVNKLAVAVVDELPFHLEIVEPKVPLVQNGSMDLKIVAKRKAGFDDAHQRRVSVPSAGRGGGQLGRHSREAERSDVSAQRRRRCRNPEVADFRARLGRRRTALPGCRRSWRRWKLPTATCHSPSSGPPSNTANRPRSFCKVTDQYIPSKERQRCSLLGLPAKVTTTEHRSSPRTRRNWRSRSRPTRRVPRALTRAFSAVVVITAERRAGGAQLRGRDGVADRSAAAEAGRSSRSAPRSRSRRLHRPARRRATKRLTRLEQLRLEAKQAQQAAT